MKESNKNKLKKQIVSGGIYIALAAAVVAVTLNGVNNIIGSTEDYEIPEVDLKLPEIDNDDIFGDNTALNPIPDIAKPDDDKSDSSDSDNMQDNSQGLSEETYEKTDRESAVKTDVKTEDLKPSGNSVVGVDSAVIENGTSDFTAAESDEVTVSGEPDDIEYPTEPDPVSYENYAKPAEGYIDKEYSDDELIYSVTMGDYRTHNGIDMTGDPGSAVKSINAGCIEDIYYDDFYGYTIKVDHGNGITAYYMNLSETLPAGIQKGVKVSHGQIIGGIGSSASIESAEVSHLHLSITVNGKYVNPRDILRGEY